MSKVTMTIGVYGIFDSKTDECLYIGLSKNIEERWKQHLKELRGKRHKRKDFVEWFHDNEATKEILTFKILEECEYDEVILNTCEIKWFNKMKPKYYGVKPSTKNKWTLSEETRRKQSETAKKLLLTIKFDKICKICNKSFISKGERALYCSSECRELNRLRKGKSKSFKVVLKKCVLCKIEFRGRENTKKCSSCKRKTTKNVYTKKCVFCEIEFQATNKRKIYCSEKCIQYGFKQNNPDWEAPKSSRFKKMNKEDLNRLYTIENRSIDEICEFFGCKERTVYYHLKNFGIPQRSYMEPNTCDTCGVVLKKRTAKNCFEHKYNTAEIKSDSFCAVCGTKTINKTAKYCINHKSVAMRESAHRQWHVNRGIVKDDCEFCKDKII